MPPLITNTSGTKCPKCEKSGFEVVEDIPNNSNFRKNYLRCMHCKTFLAMSYFNNTNVLIEKLLEHFKIPV